MSRPDDDDCAACFCRRAVHSADGCDGGGGGDPLCGCSGFVEETNVTDRHYLPPELVDNEALWCTLEGTIAGMLLRVCTGKDLET